MVTKSQTPARRGGARGRPPGPPAIGRLPDRPSPYQTGAPDTGPLCDGCGVTPGGAAAYWGDRLCAPCAADAAARFDRDGWPRPPWAVEPDAGAVVGGADGLRHGGRISRQLPRNLAQLAAFCERRGASAVWVHESAFAGLGWPAELPHLAPGAGHPSPFFDETGPYCCTYPAPPGLIHYSRWWVRGGHGVDLHVPAYSAAAPRPFRSPFAGAETV